VASLSQLRTDLPSVVISDLRRTIQLSHSEPSAPNPFQPDGPQSCGQFLDIIEQVVTKVGLESAGWQVG
jgi:hypothetical protein